MTREDAERRLRQTLAGLPREDCERCECFLGYLTQLAIDAPADAQALFAPHLGSRAGIHACLGCDPCPPATEFADYLRRSKPGGCCDGSA